MTTLLDHQPTLQVVRTHGGSLAEQIRPRQSYLRAANLERHHDQAEHYIPTGRALEILRRLLKAVDEPTSGRAWSLTGPYGAGKSSFALYVRSLFGPATPARAAADHALRDADAALADTLITTRARLQAHDRGVLLATTTCQREPLTDSLLRALTQAATSYWSRRPPVAVSTALNTARAGRSARTLAAAVEALAAHAPVLLVLDEFGKALEHFAADTGAGHAADLFVLQEIAERASGAAGTPVFLFTLQHLAFDDYVRKASAAQRREWGKVQGRFEDIPFLETSEQSLRLVAGALDDSNLGGELRRQRAHWATTAVEQVTALGLGTHLPGGAATLERCYPLHPIALLALPALCAQLGQHGRTLFTFLGSAEPHTAAAFLQRTPASTAGQPLPELRLAELYDFFAGPGHALATGVGGARWREIDERIREASGLDPDDVSALKTVGLLNLLTAAGLRASADLVGYALSPADHPPTKKCRERLADLEARGWLTYRAFADEYRLWQGSDVDLRGRVTDAREQLRATSPAELLTRLQPASPVIAGKHSQRVGMLRYFAVRYADATTPPAALDPGDPADGTLVYYLDDPATTAGITKPGRDRRPVVLAASDTAGRVRDAAVEAAAALAVLDQEDVLADRVARRELQDRLHDARARLNAALTTTFRPGAAGVAWRPLTDEGPGPALNPHRGLSRLLSGVSDSAYPDSPEIRNEMIGRRELTSQGARARRNLLEAMITRREEEQLGLVGNGPEHAMYEALLRSTGLHAQVEADRWNFKAPDRGSRLATVWGALTQDVDRSVDTAIGVDRLYARLKAPPIGLKDGPIPVLLTAFLLHRHDDVAVYEDGTYQPAVTPDLVERLLKTPQRFAVKSFSTAGSRQGLIGALTTLTAELPGGIVTPRRTLRNATILATAAPLLTLIRNLPDYTRRTSQLSPRALAVRKALLNAREPDELLFTALPAACDLEPFVATGGRRRSADLPLLTARLREALTELQNAYPTRLEQNGTALAADLHLPSSTAELRLTLAARARQLDGQVLDPKLRSFLFTAQETALDSHAWLEALSLTVADRPPASWRDEDVARFHTNLRGLVAAFRRVEALHFDAAAHGSTEGFTARRLTLTASDGTETSRVVYVDDHDEPNLTSIVSETLRRVEEQLGAHGHDALLAILADRVLHPRSATNPGQLPTSSRKVSGG